MRPAELFMTGISTADPDKIWRSLTQMQYDPDELRAACRRVAALPQVPKASRRSFACLWFSHGDHFRDEIQNDLLLADALRKLMPVYRGIRPVLLYRGEAALNRRRRAYGLCWSRSRAVSESHAENNRACYKDGTLLLQTLARPEAIICSLVHHSDSGLLPES